MKVRLASMVLLLLLTGCSRYRVTRRDVPPLAPSYPQVLTREHHEVVRDGRHYFVTVFTTADTVAQVLRWHEETFLAQGWEYSVVGNIPNGLYLVDTKECPQYTLALETVVLQQTTTVTVTTHATHCI